MNLSGVQFKLASQLDQIVTENLTRYNVAPERLELELTESVLIETTQRHGETFKRLRKIGVRLAIDDFGTGYSSLDYLRSFRVSRLKIDRRFISDVTTNADDAAIVRATIGLAHELGIEVMAEGVETAEQRDFLISAGCELAQGYLFRRADAGGGGERTAAPGFSNRRSLGGEPRLKSKFEPTHQPVPLTASPTAAPRGAEQRVDHAHVGDRVLDREFERRLAAHGAREGVALQRILIADREFLDRARRRRRDRRRRRS